MSYLGTNLNVVGSSTMNSLSSTTVTASQAINGNIWKSPTTGQSYIKSIPSSTTVNGATVLNTVNIGLYFDRMFEFTGTGGTLTTDTAANIYAFESNSPLAARGCTTTFYNGCTGSLTIAGGTGVLIRGNSIIPSLKCALVRFSINSNNTYIHITLSA